MQGLLRFFKTGSLIRQNLRDLSVKDGYRGMVSILRLAFMVVSLVLFSQSVNSQTFMEVDATTYKLYLEKNWDELIHEGKSILKSDVDYYYLRMRMGIAFYEKKNYKSAQSHFKKALEFKHGDLLANEYLYYAYLYWGQSQQSALLYKAFPESLKSKINEPGTKIIDRISVEYLYNQTFTDDLVNDPGTFEGKPYGAQIITRNYQNLNISLNHNMHPGTSLFHAYTHLGKNNYYHYDDGIARFGVDGQKVWQNQYFLSPSFTTKNGFVISPSFHFIHVRYQVPDLSGGGGPGPGGGDNIVFRDNFANQLLGGLSLLKYQGPFSYSFGATWSNLNEGSQITGSGGLTWYPLGNLDMYLGGSLHAHWTDIGKGDLELIGDMIFGYGIASKVWIEISGSYGKMKNYAESKGYIVYNGLDWMNYKVLGNLVVPLTRKGSVIYAGIRFAEYENQLIPFYELEGTDNLNIINYKSLSIFGGLSWKF